VISYKKIVYCEKLKNEANDDQPLCGGKKENKVISIAQLLRRKCHLQEKKIKVSRSGAKPVRV
jgi:hypothetical protein